MTGRFASPYLAAIAGLLGLAAALGIGRFVYTPILPTMMDALGLSAADAGLIAAANFLGYLVGAILAAGGWAAGIEGLVLAGALVANALLLFAMGVTVSVPAFLAIRFAAGIATAFVMVFLSTRVMDRLAGAGRNDLQAVHFAGVGVGIAASSMVIALLSRDGAAWNAGWFWTGAVAAASAAMVPLLLHNGGAPAARATAAEPPLPADPGLRLVVLAYGLFGFGYIITATFLIAIVRQSGGSALFEPTVWLATGLAGVPSIWLWQRVARRIGLSRTFAACCLTEAVGVAASVTLGGHVGPLLAGVLLGGTFVAATALGIQMGRKLAPLAPRRILGWMTASFGLGQIVGPVATGYLADWAGFGLPSALAALALLIAAAVLLKVPSPNPP